ncbi:hypothetical protein MANES_02G220001v8 [Manihot esculenta]|uniref:Uncharacterized protein n=1 Tax=Manihot esculenta TaxID=3983 RepID=A0ACB7I8N2_MANES|nr:hypothetical protein MANES_02G220001v8 [Manihot esculenta]
MIIITWNCHGAASSTFRNAFQEYKRLYHPNIFCLMEPRISGEAADEVCGLLGYENWIRVEAIEFSDGIWLLWSEDGFRIELVVTDPQFITVAINFSTGEKWLFSVVYASLDIYLRRKLWQSLSGENSLSISKWIVAGDFNSVVDSSEQSGYSSSNPPGAQDFSDWIFKHSLIDLGFVKSAAWLDRCNTRLDSGIGIPTVRWNLGCRKPLVG